MNSDSLKGDNTMFYHFGTKQVDSLSYWSVTYRTISNYNVSSQSDFVTYNFSVRQANGLYKCGLNEQMVFIICAKKRHCYLFPLLVKCYHTVVKQSNMLICFHIDWTNHTESG